MVVYSVLSEVDVGEDGVLYLGVEGEVDEVDEGVCILGNGVVGDGGVEVDVVLGEGVDVVCEWVINIDD